MRALQPDLMRLAGLEAVAISVAGSGLRTKLKRFLGTP